MTEPKSAEQDLDPWVKLAMAGLPDEFSGFGQIYETKLRPALLERESDRRVAAEKARKGRWIAIAAALGLGVLALVFAVWFLFPVGLIAGLGIDWSMREDLRRIGRETKTLTVLPIAEEFGLTFVEHPGMQPGLQDFRANRLLPGWDRGRCEDRISGTRNNVDFDFYEAHLEQKRTTTDSRGRIKTRWVTVFRGQCLRFRFRKRFLGRTLIARDAGWFDRFGGGAGMKIARLEDPVFEEIFTVYTTDQVEGRFLLTPDFMQRLVDLEKTLHGQKMRCAFVDGDMLVALEGGNLFEPGSLFTPLDSPERVRDLLDDFAAVFNLIDAASAQTSRGSSKS